MMTRHIFLSTLLAASIVVSSLTMAAAVSTMTAGDLKALQQAKIPVIVISIGSRELFDRLHIEGAIHLPVGDIRKVAFPPEAKIVLYPSGFGSQRTRNAGAELMVKGYQNVSILQGALATWKAAGIPLSGPGAADPALNPVSSAIPVRQLLQAINDQDDFLLVDVRSPDAFRAGHAQAAINVSLRDITTASTSWTKSKWIVVYDDGRGPVQAAMSALYRAGFTSVGYVRGGYTAIVAETPRPHNAKVN